MSRASAINDVEVAPRRLRAPTPRVAVVIAGAVIAGVVLYLGRNALTPFILGALIVYVLDPAVRFVARRRIGRWAVPRGLAVLLVYLVTIFVLVEGLALLLGPLVSQILEFVRDLPRLVAAFDSALAALGQYYQSLDLPPQIRDFIDGALAGVVEGADGFDPGALLPVARTILGTAASFLGFLIVPIWAFYLLRDRVRLTARLDQALPAEWRADVWAVLGIVDRVFGRWIRAQVLLGLIVGAATYVGLLLLGWFVDPRFLDFAVLLAVIAGLLELLPIIGPIIAMLPALLIALTTADPVLSLIAVLVLYFAVQQLENAVLVPKIQGDAVQLHPSVIIFVLILGAAIAGLPGAILSIPVTATGFAVFGYAFKRASGFPPEEATARPVEEPPPSSDAEAAEVTDSAAEEAAGTAADAEAGEGDEEEEGVQRSAD